MPQRPEWGKATAVAADDRSIAVLHRHTLGGTGGIAIMSSPSAEMSATTTVTFSATDLKEWYTTILGLCSPTSRLV